MSIFWAAVAVFAVSTATILSIWLGYPILVWGRAQRKRSETASSGGQSELPRVSVILATRDSEERIASRVANLLESAYPADLLEVVVARDPGGPTESNATALLQPRVRVVVGDAPGGKASGLNAGVRAAVGDLLVMTDTAQRFESETIARLVRALTAGPYAAVSGSLELGPESSKSPVGYYWRMERWLRANEAIVDSSIGVTGAVYIVRRLDFPTIPAGTLLDDVYVPMSLVMRGHRVGFSFEARAWDTRDFGANEEARRKERTLTGVLQLYALIPALNSKANRLRWSFFFHKTARLATAPLAGLAALSSLVAVLALGAKYPGPLMGALLVSLLLVVTVAPLRRSSARLMSWTLSMIWSVWMALRNGVTGRWTVWQKP